MANHGFSERRVSRLIGVNRSAWQYERFAGRTMLSVSGCVRSPTSAAGSATGGWRSCLGAGGKGMNLKEVYRLYRED